MSSYIDFQFEEGNYGKAAEYTDENAIILAIRNIMLSRPGNFPFTPSLGMNIKKYQFDLLDDQTIANIESELNRAISTYLPELGNVQAIVQKVEDDNGKAYLGISILSTINNNEVTANFIMGQDGEDVKVFNEIR